MKWDGVDKLASNRRGVLLGLGGTVAASALMPFNWASAQEKGGTLRVTIGGTPPDFDVHQSGTYLTQHICAPCYSTLMRIDPSDTTKLVPDLAESYEVSEDGLTVTYKIKSGVKFHDGGDLVIDDVVFSINRIRNPPTGINSPRKNTFSNIAEVEAADANTLKVTLKQPQADFPYLVSNPFNAIYPKRIAEPLDAEGVGMKRQIVGTGAFKLARAVDGQLYELVRNDDYFGGAPNLDGIQFFPIPGEIERSVALRGDRVDACFLFSSQAVISDLKKAEGLVVGDALTPTFVNLISNVLKKPFDDPRVREALSLAIDRTAFINTVGPLSGANFHSLGLLPPGSPYALTEEEVKQFAGYDTIPGLGGDIEANRARARELLKEAGVEPGYQLKLPTRGDLPVFRDSSINVAAQLNTIGFDASVEIMDVGAFVARELAGEFEVLVHSIAVAGALPDIILGDAYTSFGYRNYGKWKDDSIDALFRAQSGEADPEKRKELIRQQQLAFLGTYYHINMAWVGFGFAHTDRLKGWTPSNDGFSNMQMDKVWLES